MVSTRSLFPVRLGMLVHYPSGRGLRKFSVRSDVQASGYWSVCTEWLVGQLRRLRAATSGRAHVI